MESEIFLVKKITALEKQRKLRPKSIIFVLSKESKTRETLFDYFNVNLIDKEVTQNAWASFEMSLSESVVSFLSNQKQFDKDKDIKIHYTLILAGKDYDKMIEREKERERAMMNSSFASNPATRGTVTYKPSRPDAYFLVYDPMEKESFVKVQEIYRQIAKNKKEPEVEKTKDGSGSNTPSRKPTKNFQEKKSFGALEPIILFSVIGENKTREVSYNEGKNFANENGMLFYEINEENKNNIKSACENIITIIEYNKRFEK